VSFSAGFITHSMYSALIHAHFWLPHAFPPHVRADAKPFTSDALPYLTMLSAVWMGMFFVCEDPLSVASLHVALNIGAAHAMGLQPPWADVSA